MNLIDETPVAASIMGRLRRVWRSVTGHLRATPCTAIAGVVAIAVCALASLTAPSEAGTARPARDNVPAKASRHQRTAARPRPHGERSARSRAPVLCHGTDYGKTPYVECVVESSGHIDFPEDVPVLVGNLSSNTPVTLTAVGGRGGVTSADCCMKRGKAGEARTVVNYGALANRRLHAYIGESGGGCCGDTRFNGGAATMALSAPLHHGLTLDDVYLIAAGSGAQGRFYTNYIAGCGAGAGGDAHRADAAHSYVPVSAPGSRGGQGSRTPPFCTKGGVPGTGGGDGVGGIQDEDSRLNGHDGIGGRGGGSSWIEVHGDVPRHWMPGHGGRTSDHAQGGGGYGGGAAGTRGSGAGGGGSWAAAATASGPAFHGFRSRSSVTIAFPQPKIDLRVLGRHGGGGAIDFYVDGKLRETLGGGRRTVAVPGGYVVAVTDPRFLPNVGFALLARPAAGSRFIGWSGAAVGQNPQVVTLNDEDMMFTAEFVPTDAIAAADGHGRVTVKRVGGAVLCQQVRVCEAPHQVGEEVRVTATPDPIAEFSHFEGPCDSAELDHCTGRIHANAPFVATFRDIKVTLTLRVHPLYGLGIIERGNTTVCGFSIGLWTCALHVLEHGPMVELHAASAGIEPVQFDRWSGACTGTNPRCTIDPSRGHQSVTATFR